jgi:hypothetical protein
MWFHMNPNYCKNWTQFLDRREILRSLTKKQESFATASNNGMKPFAFIMVTRTAMEYTRIENCAERAPRTGDENPFHELY